MPTETDIVNSALRRGGGAKRIADLTDSVGSAGIASDVLAQERDDLLRAGVWNFAITRTALAQLSTAPAFGFAYAYTLPSDNLRVVSVHDTSDGTGAIPYKIESVLIDDGSYVNAIVSDSSSLFLRYVRTVTDPNLMSAGFRQVLILRLAKIFAISLAKSNALYQTLAQEEETELRRAKSADGIEDFPDAMPEGTWASSRRGWGNWGSFFLTSGSSAAVTSSDDVAASKATWSSVGADNATLSNGNLTVSNAATVTNDQGAMVSTGSGKTSGKYYYEITLDSLGSGFNYNGGPAVGRTTATYLNLVGDGGVTTGGTNGVIVFVNGLIYASGVNTGVFLQSISQAGDVIAVAVDLDNYKIWFKVIAGPDFDPAADWNSSNVGANPATNAGGVAIPSGTIVPFVCFGNDSSIGAETVTANFGASAFSGSVPSGFTSGWPA